MACTTTVVLPSLFLPGSKAHRVNPPIRTGFADCGKLPGGQRCVRVAAKAVGDNPGKSSGSIFKIVQDAWEKSEDRIALVGVGFSGIAIFWASANLVAAIDKLPFVPSALEFIGILFSWWFIYRFLLFRPDREELSQIVKKSISDVLEK